MYTKKVLDTLSNLRSKTRYIVFQHKLLFNLVQDLFKWIEVLGRSVIAQVRSERENVFGQGCMRKKYSIRCQISRSQNRYIVFQYKMLFNPVKDLFKWIEVLGRSVIAWVQSERVKIFDLGCIRKKSTRYLVKFPAQKLAIVFQHKLLFNLVKDLFKWIEDLGRSVTTRVQSERERIFDPGCIRESTRYVVKFCAQKLAL